MAARSSDAAGAIALVGLLLLLTRSTPLLRGYSMEAKRETHEAVNSER